MVCGNTVLASGEPAQPPPSARSRIMKKGWSKTHAPPAGRLAGDSRLNSLPSTRNRMRFGDQSTVNVW
jgi:hypothetical protein